MNVDDFLFEVKETDVWYNAGVILNSTKKYKAIMETKSGKLISIVPETYRLVTNQEVIEPLLEAVDQLGLERVLGNDSYVLPNRMRLHLIFPEIKIRDDSEQGIQFATYLSNSYDGSEGVRFLSGGLRLVCTNGMVIGSMINRYYHKHTKGIDVEKFKIIISQSLEKVPEIEQRIHKMIEQKINLKQKETKQLLEDLEKCLGKKITKQVTWNLSKAKDKNLWVLFNLFTYILSHQIQNRRIRQMKQQQLSKIFGI
ncbi:MAG: DUF932 domain-containing protein [Promethearchaeota archaeon]